MNFDVFCELADILRQDADSAKSIWVTLSSEKVKKWILLLKTISPLFFIIRLNKNNNKEKWIEFEGWFLRRNMDWLIWKVFVICDVIIKIREHFCIVTNAKKVFVWTKVWNAKAKCLKINCCFGLNQEVLYQYWS